VNVLGWLLKHPRFFVFQATARWRISEIWRQAWRAAGRYKPFSAHDNAIEMGPEVRFKGDIPIQIKSVERVQARVHFRQPRPLVEDVRGLTVTPNGAGWVNGVLHERYSASTPGLRMLTSLPKGGATEIVERAIFIQSAHRDSFGDWVSEYLLPLARMSALDAPLLLPIDMAQKPYVKRDLARLGIDYRAIEKPTLVKNAQVLRQQKFFVYYYPNEIAPLRRLLGVDAPEPEPGSILYLSRRGEMSEIANRSYPNKAIEEVVMARGGRVILTGQATLDEYITAANAAETVIFDHGSAVFNMLYWRPRRAIEIASDRMWHNALLMFVTATGVSDYTIIRGDDGGPARVQEKLNAALDQPMAT